MNTTLDPVIWFENLTLNDTPIAGGKNASLGEMIGHLQAKGISVPSGFATTAEVYREYIATNRLEDPIRSLLDQFNSKRIPLEEAGARIRTLIVAGKVPHEIAIAIETAYEQLSNRCRQADVDVAVRSSATAEDLPEASFAGQQASYLNISGKNILQHAHSVENKSALADFEERMKLKSSFLDNLKTTIALGGPFIASLVQALFSR